MREKIKDIKWDLWGLYPLETIVSGPYLYIDSVAAYLRATFDVVSNSGTVTLLVWADGWAPLTSIVWCPGEVEVTENTSDDEGPKNPGRVLFSREPEYHHRFGGGANVVLEHMFAYLRHSETLKDLATLTDMRRAELCEEEFADELPDELEKIGTLNLYPLDGTDYEYRRGTSKWEPLGSWHEQFENEFNK